MSTWEPCDTGPNQAFSVSLGPLTAVKLGFAWIPDAAIVYMDPQ